MIYGSDTFRAFEQWYEYAKQHYIARFDDDQLPKWVTFYYDPLLDLNHTIPLSGSWVNWGFFLLPNDRAMARRFYEVATRGSLVQPADGTAYMAAAPGMTKDDLYTTILTLSMANNLGDTEVVKKLRAHAEARYEPTWDRAAGEFYYLFGLREPYPRGQYNALIMVSEVGGPDAWWRLFNEPNLNKFAEPTVYGVDYPRMGLSQAYYDRQRRTLVLRTYPIDQSAIGSPTSFRVKQLARPDDCTVLADGAPYSGWAVREGELEVTTTIAQRSFQIIER
jgi:hypothetical protein